MTLKLPLTALAILSSSLFSAAAPAMPDITLHSDNYELYQDENLFTLAIGSVGEGQIGVDCGYGIVMYDVTPAYFDQEAGEMVATYVPCTVNKAGKVDIYCYDGTQIDYFNGDGCGITDIAFAHPEVMDILYLRHNSLQALDLSAMTELSIIDVGDNPFDLSPLVIGRDKPRLQMLAIDMAGSLSPDFSLEGYPALLIFSAYACHTLQNVDTSHCPALLQLSVDGTMVSSVDISANPDLRILNVSGTLVGSLDLSGATQLRELYCSHEGTLNYSSKLTSLDLTHCPNLCFLFASGNLLTEIDLSQNPALLEINLNNNRLSTLDLSGCPDLVNVYIKNNDMDFATLPVNPGTWAEYEFGQRPLSVPGSMLAGSSLDLSAQVLRPGTHTDAFVMGFDDLYDEEPYEIDPEDYDFADGVLTIYKAQPDSVAVYFYNTAFDETPLTTRKFKVKDAATFGAPDLGVSMSVSPASGAAPLALSVGIAGASAESPKTFYVDFGDGALVEFQACGSGLPDSPNATSPSSAPSPLTSVKVYMPEGEQLTAFGLADVTLETIDLSGSRALNRLSLVNTGLKDIDLSYNRCLMQLVLTGNDFGDRLNLDGVNGGFNKNMLMYIDLHSNGMTDVKLSPVDTILTLDLSDNELDDLNFTDAENILWLDLSDNRFEYLKLNYLSSLVHLDVSGNNLSEIVMPETNVIEHFDLRGNRFTLADLPPRHNAAEYIYAPQQPIGIPLRAAVMDLSSQPLSIDGHETVFTLLDSEGNDLREGVDYTAAGAVFTFLDAADGHTVHATIANAAYPDFAGEAVLTTTDMVVSTTPDVLVGSFVTTGSSTMKLSMASHRDADVVYIDWGDGTLVQYPLKSTYTLYNASTIPGAEVKVWTFDTDCAISVFSVSGARLSSVDLSGMKRLTCLGISDAGISEITMPESPVLKELLMPGNKFTGFDFSPFPALETANFNHNLFENLDLTGLSTLQSAGFAYNKLENVTFGGNDALWEIALNNNSLSQIDLSGAPAAYQLFLSNNRLENIDLDGCNDLRVLYLDGNRFTFSTLPIPRSEWALYTYGNQAPLQVQCVAGKVDLSSQAVVYGVESQYYWCEGQPEYDYTTGELAGAWLVEGDEYTIEDGVTTFCYDFSQAVCVIYNEVFPRTYLITEPVDVVTGIEDVRADRPSQSPACDLLGRQVDDNYRGIVIQHGRKTYRR